MDFWRYKIVPDEAMAHKAREYIESHFPTDLKHGQFERRFDAQLYKDYIVWREENLEGASAPERAAILEEEGRFGLEERRTTKTVRQVIQAEGTERQKAEWTPLMNSGVMRCSLGYTEPDSGSDVAAAKTRARKHGDEWSITGQKMFTTDANFNTHVFLLTRTTVAEDKHVGLTMFLVPLDAEGVEVRRIATLGHSHSTNMTFYTDVRVPDTARVGPVDEGWRVLRTALDIEQGAGSHGARRARTSNTESDAPVTMRRIAPTLGGEASQTFTGPGQIASLLARTVEWAGRTRTIDGRCALDDPMTRERLARIAVESEVARLLTRRNDEESRQPGVGNGSKLFWTEAYVRAADECMSIVGPSGLLPYTEAGSPADGWIEFAFRDAPVKTIVGGCSEVQRDVIAQRRLGLPRPKRI